MSYQRFIWDSPYIRAKQRYGLEIFGEPSPVCRDWGVLAILAIDRIRSSPKRVPLPSWKELRNNFFHSRPMITIGSLQNAAAMVRWQIENQQIDVREYGPASMVVNCRPGAGKTMPLIDHIWAGMALHEIITRAQQSFPADHRSRSVRRHPPKPQRKTEKQYGPRSRRR